MCVALLLLLLLLPPPDSCHSGTLLDHTEVVIEGPKEDDPEMPEVPEEESMLGPAAAEEDVRAK